MEASHELIGERVVSGLCQLFCNVSTLWAVGGGSSLVWAVRSKVTFQVAACVCGSNRCFSSAYLRARMQRDRGGGEVKDAGS